MKCTELNVPRKNERSEFGGLLKFEGTTADAANKIVQESISKYGHQSFAEMYFFACDLSRKGSTCVGGVVGGD